MGVDIPKLIEKINSEKFTRQQLENLRKNVIAKGGTGAKKVVSACESQLAALPKSRKGGGGKSKDTVAETKNGFVIMQSAFNSTGHLLKPELVEVAKELSSNTLVTDVAILKSQIKLYYKGRHFTSGRRPNKEIYWLSCLDETKITDRSVDCWKQLGNVVRGKYFATHYVAVVVEELDELHTALNCVAFT